MSLEYKSFFGKKVSHEEALKSDVKNSLISILMDTRGVSEKSFKEIDGISSEVDKLINENILKRADDHYKSGKRMNLFYEIIYDELYNNDQIKNESIIFNFKLFESKKY